MDSPLPSLFCSTVFWLRACWPSLYFCILIYILMLHSRSTNQNANEIKWSKFFFLFFFLFLLILLIGPHNIEQVVLRREENFIITCKWLFRWYNVKPFKPISLNTDLGVASENKIYIKTEPEGKKKMLSKLSSIIESAKTSFWYSEMRLYNRFSNRKCKSKLLVFDKLTAWELGWLSHF